MSETNTEETNVPLPDPNVTGTDAAADADAAPTGGGKGPRPKRAPRGEKTCYNCGQVRKGCHQPANRLSYC